MTDEELLALPDAEYEAAWDSIFDDISTVYSLRPGHVLTQEDFDAIQRFDKHYRDQEESGTDIFHRAYQQGLREGGSADIVELKNKIDAQFVKYAAEKAMRAFAEQCCDRYRDALQAILDHDGREINPSNYHHEDVIALNQSWVECFMIADEALKISPSSTWASHAVLGFRCAKDVPAQ